MNGMYFTWSITALGLSFILALAVLFLMRWKKKSNRREEIVIKDFLVLRTIHASWILWVWAFLFTVILSPYLFSWYAVPYLMAVVVLPAAAIISLIIGSQLGERLVVELYQKYDLGKAALRAPLFSFMLFLCIILLDIISIGQESVSFIGLIVSQYLVYTCSVTVLLITTILLTVPLIVGLIGRAERRGVKNV
jgi:hypothetical protein